MLSITIFQSIKIKMSRGASPTDELISMWTEQNHNCTELFVLLSRYIPFKYLNKQIKLISIILGCKFIEEWRF